MANLQRRETAGADSSSSEWQKLASEHGTSRIDIDKADGGSV
jgi:hypothetical protein